MKKEINVLTLADSYKYSHYKQYPAGVVNMYDYAEARSTKEYEQTLFVGLQGLLKEYFTAPITEEDVKEAELYASIHGVPFNTAGFMKIINNYGGYFPITIKSVPEGILVPNKNILFTIELTINDSDLFWLPSWMETFLMKVWYTCTVASRSYDIKSNIIEMSKITDETPFVDYSFLNFGDRGCTSVEAANLGGFAHLTCFRGTDNFGSIKYTKEFYNVAIEEIDNIGHSAVASEHSSVTAWGRNNEREMVLTYLNNNKNQNLIACVGDSYDIFKFTEMVTSGEFKEKIESDDYPTFVIRPDSGYPVDIINQILNIMEKNNVRYTLNSKGYKIFNKYRILWSDGVTKQNIKDVLSSAILRKYSTQNFVFGMGGGLVQNLNRDTLGFAIKCSELTFDDGATLDIYKDPITDSGKKSKRGKVTTYFNKKTSEFFTDIVGKENEYIINIVQPVFVNGKLIKEYTLTQVRENVQKCLEGRVRDIF